MNQHADFLSRFAGACRSVGAEGIVLLKNDGALPIKQGETVSLFGRCQLNYYKSGLGSGGAVNTRYVADIPTGLTKAGILLNPHLQKVYADWVKENPYDNGSYWYGQPSFQKEMPLTEQLVCKCAEESDSAIIIIGRTAGEGVDIKGEPGGFFLTAGEEDMLKKVTEHFSSVTVLLNVSSIIDMSWIEQYPLSAVVYVWQLGQEGGNAVADVVTGKVCPSGKLTATIARDYTACPYFESFGNPEKCVYNEDIYVGYRYYNTFDLKNIRYPFGYGLSYTAFSLSEIQCTEQKDRITVSVTVTNTGGYSGKETVQIYVGAPQGLLGKPAQVLVGFAKTALLEPATRETLTISFEKSAAASFDDIGVTGYPDCFVLEKGEYAVLVGTDSLSAAKAASFVVPETLVTERCSDALAPRESFDRFRPVMTEGKLTLAYETVSASQNQLIFMPPPEFAYTGDRGIKLIDVKNGKATMREFIAQLSDKDLISICLGEGMCSPKVTGGTACAFGGVTDSLLAFGVPLACGTDGPSGVRMDCGTKATSLPSGTALASSWNPALVEELYRYEGREILENKVDVILGPGMNIQRHPYNGRNFEYFSEDPFLSGQMAVAVCRGICQTNVTATLKHFCANNQEKGRGQMDTVISKRALREIYLKPFEMTVKANVSSAVMTSYNQVNGHFNAANYDLTTTVLRNEWHYDGIVMTDWWAKTEADFRANGRTEDTSPMNLVPLVEAQNDLYMVRLNAADYTENNLLSALENGRLNRGYIQRNAANICRYLMHSDAMERHIATGGKCPVATQKDIDKANEFYRVNDLDMGHGYTFESEKAGTVYLRVTFATTEDALSQINMFIFVDGVYKASFGISGTEGHAVTEIRSFSVEAGQQTITVNSPSKMITIKEMSLYRPREL